MASDFRVVMCWGDPRWGDLQDGRSRSTSLFPLSGSESSGGGGGRRKGGSSAPAATAQASNSAASSGGRQAGEPPSRLARARQPASPVPCAIQPTSWPAGQLNSRPANLSGAGSSRTAWEFQLQSCGAFRWPGRAAAGARSACVDEAGAKWRGLQRGAG